MSVRMSHDDILCINFLRTVTFLNYILIQIIALLMRRTFEELKIPYDWKIISKTKHRLNLYILKNILMQKIFGNFWKFHLIWWSKLDFRCVYFALWSCLNKHQYWYIKNVKLLKFIHKYIPWYHMLPAIQFFSPKHQYQLRNQCFYWPITYEPRSHYLITGKVPKKIALACDWYHLKAHIF